MQQYKDQAAQLRLYQENLGLIRLIGVEYGVRDMEVYLQDAYLALGDACRLYSWMSPFVACLRVHLKKAIFKHVYQYGYPVRVNYKSCKSVSAAVTFTDLECIDIGYELAEDGVVYDEMWKLMRRLSDMDQKIMRMRYEDEKTLDEIAHAFSVSAVTIHNHITKVLQFLREEMN